MPEPNSQHSKSVLVCGSRAWGWFNYSIIRERLAELVAEHGTFEVIHGGARGADMMAGTAARDLGLPIRCFEADWKKHGKAAGPIRNRQMLDEAPDLVVAFHIRGSSGTQDTIDEAKRRGIPVEVHSHG